MKLQKEIFALEKKKTSRKTKQKKIGEESFTRVVGCRDGVVVRALISLSGPGSISRLGVICGLRLLVLYSALTGFSAGTPVLLGPLHENGHLI